ncbi:CRISPR-associated helicase Cas3' [Acrocarpospora catenulata]|uniref:CRISPR-associated helicase Cas3' n=1 Tax=Acrocarpospora catenulata TaxID=2836182 RepID=UPI001BDA851F|nr:CRISPR-associated helicase Cas3' [Acrocarpospora catenulata]
MNSPWAHSVNAFGTRHALIDHLRGTAELGASFAEPFGAGRIAWWLGALHDAGKVSCAWQQRLLEVEGTGKPVGLDHKRLGAHLAAERGLGRFAMAIQGHHGGLTSPTELRNWLAQSTAKEAAALAQAGEAFTELLPELALPERPTVPTAWEADPHVKEMGLRLVFSALCDADYLDTSAHFVGRAYPAVSADADYALLRDRFERHRRVKFSGDRRRAQMDDIRDEVYRACVAAASREPGIFRLAAPTGSGKTISGAAFAVHHAAAHRKRRVVVAVPFLTITEQNADVYRELLDEGDDRVILEHHSGVDFDAVGRGWDRLAAENWGAPFVVTTMVRLFESLFDRRPAAMRRLHRLAGSVIVLDEIQALPHLLLVPILDGLRCLVEHFGVTVLLSSATQPAFWDLSPFQQLPVHDVLPDAPALISRSQRVDFEWWIDPQPTLEEVAETAGDHDQVLVVVNTTADANNLFNAWDDQPGVAWHLSTRMCAMHRRRVLDSVRKRLRNGESVKLVSTQLIEAGVDVDFPVVYRLIAPADSLLQAAGRANRDGNLPGRGRVVIVAAADAGQPPPYKTLVDTTLKIFGDGSRSLADPEALTAYYQDVYGSLNLQHPTSRGMRLQEARARFDLLTVRDGPMDPATGRRDRKESFRMIEENGVTVVTPQAEEDPVAREVVEALIERVRTAARPDLADIRRLQPYMTSLHTSALRTPGAIAQLRPILGTPQPASSPTAWNGVLAEWIGEYDSRTGIEINPDMERFVL